MSDLDDFLNSFINTPQKKARVLRYFWVISLLMLIFGFVMILFFWERGI